MKRFILSLLACVHVLILSPLAVALLLHTKWDGRTTWFGNAKHGRGADRGYVGYWQELSWLVWRNPINNFLSDTLSVPCRLCIITGDAGIGDHTYGGFYKIKMGNYFEIYRIIPYGKRCIRFRAGWKISGKTYGDKCELVFTLNPWAAYSGS